MAASLCISTYTYCCFPTLGPIQNGIEIEDLDNWSCHSGLWLSVKYRSEMYWVSGEPVNSHLESDDKLQAYNLFDTGQYL